MPKLKKKIKKKERKEFRRYVESVRFFIDQLTEVADDNDLFDNEEINQIRDHALNMLLDDYENHELRYFIRQVQQVCNFTETMLNYLREDSEFQELIFLDNQRTQYRAST